MDLTKEQEKQYESQGFFLAPSYFSKNAVNTMKAELPGLFAEDSPRRVVEKNSHIVRSVYGSHMTNDVFRHLAHHPWLVHTAEHLLGSKVYIYQFKINAKAAFGGDLWEWHQDYIFWRKEDGVPTARLLNVVIFLDEVTEFNGPLFLIPGSHREGSIDISAREGLSGSVPGPAWISNLTADLKYSLGREQIAALTQRYGIVAPKGPAGSTLFFHSNLVHSSPANMSPFDRAIAIVTYNSVENTPTPVANPRPDFLAARDYSPITPLQYDAFGPDMQN